MTTNDALTTIAAQVETILTDHSVTYTTTDNRGEEDGDYRITVGDVTAYLTVSDDGGVWATTDENPADAYDGPANVDEIALHLMHYAAEVPAVVAVIYAVMNETASAATATYWDGYWEVEDAHTAIEVDTDGDAGTRVYSRWGSGHPGVLVTEEHDDTESWWVITDLDTVTTSVQHSAQDAAATVIYTLA